MSEEVAQVGEVEGGSSPSPPSPSHSLSSGSSSSSTSISGLQKKGRTFGGTEFEVPETFDFLENLFKRSLNVFDWVLFGTIVIEVLLFMFSGLPAWFFALLFAFWRLAYNIGLGVLLHYQSNDFWLQKKLSPYLEKGSSTAEFLKVQLSRKMGDDYDFDRVPIEYNCWLLYRALVDYILLNDFTTYFLCVFSYFEIPEELSMVDVALYAVGLCFVVFNWFIKVDALRVVKDFAWYWGDFFFLIEAELTFDGVFQMAPHPMYSIGYIGYYGMSMISRSYAVLYVSLAAHLCQFLFLGFVENPHIDKIYNTGMGEKPRLKKQRAVLYEGPSAYFRRDLIVFKNFDMFRSADLFTAAFLFYSTLIYFMNLPTWFYITQCVLWRLFHSIGLGYVLKKQSSEKLWAKHFLKHGFSLQEAFSNWKSIYNLSLTMTHTSFLFCALKVYQVPEQFLSGTTLVQHTIGILLICLHVWTSVEVYEVIGDFGWFYGDFFVSVPASSPEYTGIYRFLNNPEKVMGHAGQFGVSLITGSWIMFAITLFSQSMTFLFLDYVETVHMKKLYGTNVRASSGLTSALSDKIKPLSMVRKVSKLTSEVSDQAEGMLQDLTKEVKELGMLVDKAKPKLTSIVENLSDTTTKIARPVILKDVDPSQFRIQVRPAQGSAPHRFTLGQPIEIMWEAPEDHSERDWIGIYPLNKKSSAEGLTVISSKGRWSLVGPGTSGVIRFSADKLPWKQGVYEFRYHHDYGYAIVAISEAVEINSGPDLEPIQDRKAVTEEFLQRQLVVIFKRLLENELIGPEDSFRGFAGKAKSWERKASALTTYIKNAYGVEFSKEIVDYFPTPKLLAHKLREAILELGNLTPQPSSDEVLSAKKDQ